MSSHSASSSVSNGLGVPCSYCQYVVGKMWVGSNDLGAVQPLDVPEPPPHLTLLLLSPGHLLLLFRPELHVVTLAFGLRHDRRSIRARVSRRHVRASNAASRPRVLEAVHADCQVALVCDTAICDVPLFGAQSADELFVVGDHDDTTLVVPNSNSETTEGVTVQEVSGFVEDEQVGVVPHSARCKRISNVIE
jgi:hypothetical protein